jgi:TolA-binding protein
MYGGGSATPKPSAPPPDKFKQASRVIGGLKAQNAHTKTVEIEGEYHTFPKAEYVAQMETQLREARNTIRELTNKTQRLARQQAKMVEKMRQIEQELANKIDAR